MILNRLFVLVLILSVTVREDSALLASLPHVCRTETCDGADADQPVPDSCADSSDADSNLADGASPDRDELPQDNGEMAVILEIDLDDLQTEEMLCPGDHRFDPGFVAPCLVHETDNFQYRSSNSLNILNRLHI